MSIVIFLRRWTGSRGPSSSAPGCVHVRPPVRDDDGTLDPPPAPPRPPPPPPPPERKGRGAECCGGRYGGRGAGLGLRGPGGSCPPRHVTTAAAAVFVQLALRWGHNWAAQWHLPFWGRNWAAQWHYARTVGKRFRGCRAKHLYVYRWKCLAVRTHCTASCLSRFPLFNNPFLQCAELYYQVPENELEERDATRESRDRGITSWVYPGSRPLPEPTE